MVSKLRSLRKLALMSLLGFLVVVMYAPKLEKTIGTSNPIFDQKLFGDSEYDDVEPAADAGQDLIVAPAADEGENVDKWQKELVNFFTKSNENDQLRKAGGVGTPTADDDGSERDAYQEGFAAGEKAAGKSCDDSAASKERAEAAAEGILENKEENEETNIVNVAGEIEKQIENNRLDPEIIKADAEAVQEEESEIESDLSELSTDDLAKGAQVEKAVEALEDKQNAQLRDEEVLVENAIQAEKQAAPATAKAPVEEQEQAAPATATAPEQEEGVAQSEMQRRPREQLESAASSSLPRDRLSPFVRDDLMKLHQQEKADDAKLAVLKRKEKMIEAI